MPRVAATLVLGVTLIAPAAPAWPANHWGGLLPAGEGKELTVKLCGSCHNLQKTVVAKKTPKEWERSVYDMISRGAQIFPDEAEQIIQYLSAHFKP